jgi:CheY-like chemotaxis protein
MSTEPKILAVDDEEFNLDIMDHHLVHAGYRVVRAEDGIAALRRLEENADIEVIVLDRMMPNLGGMEFLEQIKADARFQDIPVVMQTAAAATDQIVQGIKAGVHYYLTKPYEGAILIGIVNAALRDAKTKRKLRERVRGYGRMLGLMEKARFHFQTLDEAANLADYIANCFPEPEKALFGLRELMINAVEHGNLGISYSEKTKLLRDGVWSEEIERRLRLPENQDKFGSVTFEATKEAVTVHIKDEGKGFDWRDYLEISPNRATDPHGRGIAASRMMSFHSLEYLGAGNEVRCTAKLAGKSA